jgi:hypothetical protein
MKNTPPSNDRCGANPRIAVQRVQPARHLRSVVSAAVMLGVTGCASILHSVTADTAAPGTSKNAGPVPAHAQNSVREECHPEPASAAPQYIIGYGSLMQDESRQRTSPNAGPAQPVDVSGFRRGWFAKGSAVGFSTTFLGVVPDAGSHLNAVAYRIDLTELKATDRRETSYCRTKVPSDDVMAKVPAPMQMRDGEAWIYVNTPGAAATPTAQHPIVQSYVDIFLSGCFEQEERFKLQGFARECLATTANWSANWVNDRVYPRRPFIYQPRAGQIDLLLSRELPDLFSRIRIE